MDSSRSAQRAIFQFLRSEGENAPQIYRRMKEVYREQCLAQCTIFRWCQRYEAGRVNIKDLPRPGQVRVVTNSTTISDEDDLIRQIAHRFDCEKDYSDRCGFYDDLAEERFRKLRGLVADVCREDSPLHLGIVQNIGCLNEVIEGDLDVCHRHLRAKVRVMIEYIRNIEVGEGYEGYTRKEEIWTSFSCL
ncbi:hypothetical protein AVEN_40094-1 [Araneus ventricosus]|uniref:Mos1 transposase HTH domain-containing protein n=1 Tax=Araneus ventricosus TaxID=182803 RepID=A0A4Y2J1S3_ARAVE|nr:hypothetical protein AVEN_40094-1 [Araneus ventricosus]